MVRRHQQRKSSDGHHFNTEVTRLTPLGRTRRPQDDEEPSNTPRPLCRFYVLHKGNCRFGSDCAYSHQLPDGMNWEEAKTLVPCPFFARGDCRYGEFCQLRHDPNDLVVKTSATSTSASPVAAEAGVESNDDTEDFTVTCGICLEDMPCTGCDGESNRRKKTKQFGLLSCCNHTFCFNCLMEWRKEGSQDASDRRSCPTCRKHSDYVVPSRVFPSSEEQKANIVQEYKDKLAHIPCRRFQETQELGSCPFGRDCWYLHLDENGVDVKLQDKSLEELSQERQRAQEERRRRQQRDFRSSLLGSADSTFEDIDILLSFLRLLDLYGYQGVREIYWSDDEDDDDDFLHAMSRASASRRPPGDIDVDENDFENVD